MEPAENIVFVYTSCVDERKANFQANLEENIALIKEKLPEHIFVKKGFKVNKKSNEYMWVQVSAIEASKGVLYGTLNNDPVRATNVKYGDVVEVAFTDIINITYIENDEPVLI